jgi:hypothetical protein
MGFNFGELLNGVLWGTILGVGVSLLTGGLIKGIFTASPDIKEKVTSQLPPSALQDLQNRGLL